jgi:hypothetical protein
MISGKCILQVVYIGDSGFVRIKQEEKVEFIVRELSVGSEK